jgi:hypothetical protein
MQACKCTSRTCGGYHPDGQRRRDLAQAQQQVAVVGVEVRSQDHYLQQAHKDGKHRQQ